MVQSCLNLVYKKGQGSYQLTSESKDEAIGRVVDRTGDQAIDRTGDRAIDRTGDRAIDRTGDRAIDREGDRIGVVG